LAASVLARRELAGPYLLTPQRRDAVLGEIRELALPSIEIRPSATGRTDWLAGAGRALGFPDSFGANFDALFDSLCDRELLPQPTLVLRLGNTAGLDEAGCDTLIAVLQAAADEWRDQGRSLWALFDGPGLDLDALPR